MVAHWLSSYPHERMHESVATILTDAVCRAIHVIHDTASSLTLPLQAGLADGYAADPTSRDNDGIFRLDVWLCILDPATLRADCLRMCHDVFWHFGFAKMLAALLKDFHWPTLPARPSVAL
ncbi:hypothetical protein BDK51DRAFT_44990 [Blyttiomyces helicus]|uniref:Integrase zinc-binding domain-containing protein n=1 Tax=Blyttiomyces helicus TaxID=388810 RepID=A0A4V1IRW4_9FUNG|nr:hypothetical protein BDK51DRAFT_44990 [Blyttiomyces helicus]|eukprot:RKO91467.1 hypothetical protein BDK51DRAFT_44990 [Blyttiomyces helicus]